MKKIITAIAFISALTVTSCSKDDDDKVCLNCEIIGESFDQLCEGMTDPDSGGSPKLTLESVAGSGVAFKGHNPHVCGVRDRSRHHRWKEHGGCATDIQKGSSPHYSRREP